MMTAAEVAGTKRKEPPIDDTSEHKKLKRESKDKKLNTSILGKPDEEKPVELDAARRDTLATASHLLKDFGEPFSSSPALLRYTKCGQVPHVTRDLTEGTGVSIVTLQSVIAPLRALPSLKISDYLKINNVLLTHYDSHQALDLSSFNDNNTISVWGKSGRVKVCNKDHLDFIRGSQPEMFVCLADVVPATVSPKRADKSCWRTINWITESLTYISDNPGFTSKPLAMLPGSGHRQLMLKAASILSERGVAGYVVERATLPEGWSGLVNDVVSLLPQDKPVFFMGARSPKELVTALRCGCHFVDSSCTLTYSDYGRALLSSARSPEVKPVPVVPTVDFGPALATGVPNQEVAPKKKKETGKVCIFGELPPEPGTAELNLRDRAFQRDFVAIESTCTCFTCTRHTRGYINHLLLTNELLGPTLLQLHNNFHLDVLLQQARQSLTTNGSLHDFCNELPS